MALVDLGARVLGDWHDLHAQRLDPPTFHLTDGEHGAAGGHTIADRRDPSERAEDVATDRRVLLFRHLQLVAAVELSDVGAPGDDQLTVCRDRDYCVGLIVLVEDLADDFLQQVLHGHDAGRSAVLVDHDRHMVLESLEIGQDIFDLPRARNDVGGTHDRGRREIRSVFSDNGQKVFSEQNADDVVDRIGVHGIT